MPIKICEENEVKINYQLELEKKIKSLNGEKKRLLLHSCCAPCSSYVLEYLKEFFDITVLYYNPNIYPEDEFEKRAEEQKMLAGKMGGADVVILPYDPGEFYSAVKGYEGEKEGAERCFICYRLRLEKTAQYAADNGFDYFCTTLSISPLKNAQKLNEIGAELANKYDAAYLYSDFKKKNGYKRSVELSAQYGLYRQNYCGCVFSKKEADERENAGRK